MAASAVLLLAMAVARPTDSAEPFRVLSPGRAPSDARLGPLRGEQGDFAFVPASSVSEWQARAERTRRIMLVAMGLWPMPTKTPLEPVIHGRLDLGDYTVEKVYFQSLPGFYVTGSLYRPKGALGKRPGVLSPHGHFPGGRFLDIGREEVRWQIARGAERFEEGGRSFMQARCVQLARMGCVVLHYDMIGYGDSLQIPLDVAHRFSRSRVQFDRPPERGLYSPASELWLQNVLGLQTYNSIRALDLLAGLPDVDPQRIAVTGGSGGGTQTFMLCAVDDRPLVSVPAVIVSTTRQGGCTCENVSHLRIGTYNLEFTALHSPQPLLLISADDATRTMPDRGFPELQQHYSALGAEQNVSHAALLHFPHNYNYVSRTAMYHWLNKNLRLGLDEPILETPYDRLTPEELTVWNDAHPRPNGGSRFELELLDWLTADARQQLAALTPRDGLSLERYRQVVGGGWEVLLRGLPADVDVRFERLQTTDRGGYRQDSGLLSYGTVEGHPAELPVVRLEPSGGGRRTVIWVDHAGKAGLFERDHSLRAPIQALLDSGLTVVAADLLEQGELVSDHESHGRQRWLPGEEAFAGWTYCYNLPLFARRVHDVLAVVAQVRGARPADSQVDLVGLGGAGHWVAAATALASRSISRAVIDTRGFRFADLDDVYDDDFLPGAARYGDLPGLLALAAPTRLWLAGEDAPSASIAAAAYRAAGSSQHLTLLDDSPETPVDEAAIRWLLSDK